MKELLSLAKKHIERGNSDYALEALLSISDNFDKKINNTLSLLSSQLVDVNKKEQAGLGYAKESKARIESAILNIISYFVTKF